MEKFDIHISGVGGQGIGLLSEILLRAADHAGRPVKAVDTHGLAQRGGLVVSRLRLGEKAFSPLIMAGRADLAVSLERHEALRCLGSALKPGGALVYYDAEWQPLEVRLRAAPAVKSSDITTWCQKMNVREIKIFDPDLEDPRSQNIVVLAGLEKNRLIPGVEKMHYLQAMDDLMAGSMLEKNKELFLRSLEA